MSVVSVVSVGVSRYQQMLVGVSGVSRCHWCQLVSVVSVCVSGVSLWLPNA